MLLTGEPGTGKTTALRFFFASLKEQSFFPVYLPLSTVGITEFYQQINSSLGGEPCSRKNRLFASIQKRILELAANQRQFEKYIGAFINMKNITEKIYYRTFRIA
jgi:general secretion pathway protein A